MSEPSVNNNDNNNNNNSSSSSGGSGSISINSSSAATVITHESYPRPVATGFDGKDEIKFHHPGYPPPHDFLFMLPRLDRSSGSLKGVHYGTALTACQIIANNAFDGYLATDREGRDRVDSNLDFDHLLTKSDYWFFVAPVPQSLNPYPYPVVPSFRDWAFPHQRIPRWVRPERTTDSDTVGHRCIITRTAGFINQAYLIPAADKKWFGMNVMFQYGNSGHVNQRHNKVALRHDLRLAFDTHLFAIVPKNNDYVVHQLHAAETSTREFASAYHNYKVAQQDVIPEFLFARFARAILMLIKPFIAQAPINRYVSRLRAVDNNETGGRSEFNMKSEWLSPEQLADQYGGRGTGSASPSKRKRDDESDGDSSDTEGEWYKKNVAVLLEGDQGGNSDDSDTEGEWYEKNVAVLLEGDRGRPRKRRWDNNNNDDDDDDDDDKSD
ncbi:hypothetical protein SAMD00023353_6400550 [Rosellinia necatrix]|uniref:HNH nuclease domain-containing protein n=1 Tax=Rosellinia necatrix TaxID=77044 RepID=A0A1W2TSU3_ROSNE|nr:hypothetical protein SAMD00023353_6400550 [Rosellinia necatrix]